MKLEKEYFAFISYKREDEKWARWLAHQLDNYKLPSTLNGKELPPSLRKTFRDVDELSAGNLPEQIYNALSASDNLIVVCSPRSAKSEWVNKEIEDFINSKSGNTDHIFPFIIDGIPNSNDPNNECFPEKLRNLPKKEERLGGNINEQGGRYAAVVKVIAGMLGVSFDSLWNRYEREQKRKRLLGICIAMIVAFVGIGFGWYYSMQNKIIESQKLSLESATTRLREDSLRLSAQNDSIRIQNFLINRQRDSLDISSKKLELSNSYLVEERNKVLKANWKMQENISRRITEEINKAINNGDLYFAQRLTKEIIPSNIDYPDKPFLHETENAIRTIHSFFSDSIYKSVGILGKGDYSFFMGDNKLVSNEINHCTVFVFSQDGLKKAPFAFPLGMNSGKDYCNIWNLKEGTHNKIEGAFWAWNNGHYLNAISNYEYMLFVRDSLAATDYVELPISFSQQYVSASKPHTLSRSGKYVAYNIGDSVFIYNILKKKIELSVNASMSVSNITISPNENRFLFLADSILYEYDMERKKRLMVLPHYIAAEYSKDGSMIYAAKRNDTIDIVTCNNGKIEKQLNLSFNNCSKISISPDERLLAIICGKDIVLWDLQDAIIKQTMKGYNEIKDFSFCQNMDYFVTTDNNHDVRLWSKEAINPRGFNLLQAEKEFFFDNLWMSPSKDYFVINKVPKMGKKDSLDLIIYDLNKLNIRKIVRLPIIELPIVGQMIYRYALYNNIFAYAITSNRSSSVVVITDLDSGDIINVFEYPQSINSISFSPDGKEFIVQESKITYYNSITWTIEHEDSLSKGNIAIRKRFNGLSYITNHNRNVEISKNLKAIEAIIKSDPMISNFGLSKDEVLFATQKPLMGIIKVYNLSTGKINEYKGVEGGSGKMWFNDDNTTLFIENFKGLYILNLKTGKTSTLLSSGRPFVMGYNYYLYYDHDVVSVRSIPTIKEIISTWKGNIMNFPLTKEERQLYYLE